MDFGSESQVPVADLRAAVDAAEGVLSDVLVGQRDALQAAVERGILHPEDPAAVTGAKLALQLLQAARFLKPAADDGFGRLGAFDELDEYLDTE